MRAKGACAVFSAALLSAGLASADTKPDLKALHAGPIEVTATPITTFGRAGTPSSTGKLTWRGGLLLQSANENFGGWSGLAIDPDGRNFLAVSDAGAWLSGKIVYDGNRPTGVGATRIGPLLTQQGQALKRGRDRDAEAVAIASGSAEKGEIFVAFEQNARIASYGFSGTGVSPTKSFLPLPDGAGRMRRNGGLEAMTVMKGGPFAGSVIAFSERLRDAEGNRSGWIWSKDAARPLSLTDIGGLDITDVASLEDGSLLVLERRFRWLEGLSIRVRLIEARDVGVPRAVSGEVLLEADLTQEIDNMEGLSVSRDGEGTLILTLISDDNFNRYLQRTLLLQFALENDPARAAKPKTAKARP